MVHSWITPSVSHLWTCVTSMFVDGGFFHIIRCTIASYGGGPDELRRLHPR